MLTEEQKRGIEEHEAKRLEIVERIRQRYAPKEKEKKAEPKKKEPIQEPEKVRHVETEKVKPVKREIKIGRHGRHDPKGLTCSIFLHKF